MKLIVAIAIGSSLLVGFAAGIVVSDLRSADPIRVEGRFLPEDIAQRAYALGFEDGQEATALKNLEAIDARRDEIWNEGYDAAVDYVWQDYYRVDLATRDKVPYLAEVCGR